jgi:DNA-directed RNA polymerase subunit RPC12/RpoP
MRGDMDLGNNEAAFEKGESLLKRLKDRKEQEIAKGLIYMMVRAEGELKHAKEVAKTSVSLETPERWLTEARNLMEKQEYKSAEYYIREAEFALQAIARGVSVGDSGGQQAAAPAPVEGKTYACPSCSTSFTIDTPQRPVKVQCPGCHLELVIREDVTYA